MALVDVERLYSIFHLFAVTPTNPTTSGSRAAKESYIPAHLLAVATREAGFYPTTAAVHQFIKSVPTASAGKITFAAFLQFCEDVVYTNQLGRSGIYKLVDSLDTHGGGMISSRELFLILTNGSADISNGEVEAVMELLDPRQCGYIELNGLAALLIVQCQRQQLLSLVSRLRSRPDSHTLPTTSTVDPVEVEQRTRRSERRRYHHHHMHHTPLSDSQPRVEAERPRRRGEHRFSEDRPRADHSKRRVRRFSKERDSKEGEAQHEPALHPLRESTSSSCLADAKGAVKERDRSFKRTDIGSNGLVPSCMRNSLCNRASTFERTHTSMTVNVDVPPSEDGTMTPHRANEGVAHTPPRRGLASSGACMSSPQSPSPTAPAAPLPLRSSSAGAAPTTTALAPAATEEPRQAIEPPARTEDKEEKTWRMEEAEDGPLLYPQEDGDDETNCYSRAEGSPTMQLKKGEQQSSGLPMAASRPAPGKTTPQPPRNLPQTKKANPHCCVMF
ncbi:hypothetical protein ABL78_4752 [Leptomonas seymouri]|uniref:EF-hand domain-containing protein n=1 Tax=Leptomonas seymouri TaxID=5684 RepID=A0A0N0P595_LEPSE|nr:hypothetical protein ABL78_4752 [Leptomonas seymouri]|eukprot:KPI86199.1 hypothetical protein ABL78_4752 [Leptomonas seymouri]